MKKIPVLMLLFCLTTAAPAYSENYVVRSVDEQAHEAILLDTDTDEEWVVREGDHLNNSVVYQIRQTHVTIFTRVAKNRVVAAMISNMVEESTPLTNR